MPKKPAALRALIVRVPPLLAAVLRGTYRQMQKDGIAPGDDLRDACLLELMNLPDRWGDALANNEEP